MNNIEANSEKVHFNSSEKIKHEGIVEFIDAEYVRVRIVQTSACAACKISSHCNASEKKVKTIDVYGVKNNAKYQVGQEVIVCASRDVAFRALFYGFCIPLIILIAAIMILYLTTGNEALSALVGMASLIPYYIGLYLQRDKLRNKMRFWIEEKY